jgi:hypothetical protein
MHKSKSQSNFISWVRKTSTYKVITLMLMYYLIIVIAFGLIYYYLNLIPDLERKISNLPSFLYFSIITTATVGFGDFTVSSNLGKLLVSLQVVISILYTAYMTAIFVAKFFYPLNAIIFSKKILYREENKRFIFRVININRDKLLNPDIRISVEFSGHGDVILPVMPVDCNNGYSYLGKHDMSFDISGEAAEIAYNEYLAAKQYEIETHTENRFSINITVTGTYGIQNTSVLYRYYAKDIVKSNLAEFVAINWIGKDQDKRSFLPPFHKYHSITATQWKQFDDYTI